MQRFVIGDIHGAYRAMVQCFERSGFHRNHDLLICLGDLCDGWPEVSEVMDSLTDIRNLVLLMGNHDQWMINWFENGAKPDIWLSQGGDTTIKSFASGISDSHRSLMKRAQLYHILENKLFVHAGLNPEKPIEEQSLHDLTWDRTLVNKALFYKEKVPPVKLSTYDRIFVGHTPTINFGQAEPIMACELCLMDTGARWPNGVLTMLNIDTYAFYSSDVVTGLYKDL